jgi:glucose dehydrogenase
MAAFARAAHYRRDSSALHYSHARRALLAIAGSLLSLAGAVLALGGYLSPLRGSAFHMFIGVALIVSGILLAKRNRVGAWAHLIVFATTVSWSLRDLGDGSSFLFRLIGPAAILAVLALIMPVLGHWRPRRAVVAFMFIMVGTVAIAAASRAGEPLASTTGAFVQFLDAQTKGPLQ